MKKVFKIQIAAETPGQVQDELRKVIRLLDQGHLKGDAWVFGEGEVNLVADVPYHVSVPHETADTEFLKKAAVELHALVSDENLTDDKIIAVCHELLPNLSGALGRAGYRSEASETKPGEELGGGDEETVISVADEAPGASQDATEGVKPPEKKKSRFPWAN